MKSLHVSDLLDSGGAEAVFRDTVRAARSLGHDTKVVVSDGRRTPLSYLWSIRWFMKMRHVLRDFEPDVIHVQNYYRFLSPSILLAIRGYVAHRPKTLVVFTAHDYHLVCPNSGLQHFPRGRRTDFSPIGRHMPLIAKFDERSIIHGTLKALQHVIAYRVLKLDDVFDTVISPSVTLSEVFRSYGLTRPIRIVRNPVDTFDVAGRSSMSGNLVYLGRVAPEKGLYSFVELLERAAVRVTIDVFGTGSDLAKLENLSKKLVYVRVLTHDPVPRGDLPDILRGFQAIICPSAWIENAPIVVIEGISAGLPCIVPRRTGAAEMATHGTVTYEFSLGDRASTVAAVKRAISDRKTNQLRDRSLFSFDAYVRELESVYALNR
ncbi:glycosyltransferase [Paramicrobacterium sp. CJ85]|uniref:glycosyltransferase n=1 Tax=Paramicrobacterium sp. CJ85 TaxID=3445355 RepID=UPI003F62F543